MNTEETLQSFKFFLSGEKWTRPYILNCDVKQQSLRTEELLNRVMAEQVATMFCTGLYSTYLL